MLSIRKFSGVFRLLLMVLAVLVAGCSVTPQAVTLTPTLAATVTDLPTAAPTATDLPTATTAPTATALPTVTSAPTATPVPPLAVLNDGFNVWCWPIDAGAFIPTAPEPPPSARLMQTSIDGPIASIPGSLCTISFRLNQPAPEGLTLRFLQGTSPFLQLQLAESPTNPDTVWTVVDHPYVVNPPYWEVTYQLSLVTAEGQELWAQPVKFAKPLPEPCLFGGLPDPVTLYCPISDPLEIEPWPDVTYPYDRSKLTPNP